MINKENARAIGGLGVLLMMTGICLQVSSIAFWPGTAVFAVGGILAIVGRVNLRK